MRTSDEEDEDEDEQADQPASNLPACLLTGTSSFEYTIPLHHHCTTVLCYYATTLLGRSHRSACASLIRCFALDSHQASKQASIYSRAGSLSTGCTNATKYVPHHNVLSSTRCACGCGCAPIEQMRHQAAGVGSILV